MTTTGSPASDLAVRTTLLHRPRPPVGSLVREDLLRALGAGLDRTATLIAAPAGFGKTVLASQWCERLDRPTVWISLAPAVDGLRNFLLYLAAGTDSALRAGTTAMPTTRRLVDLPGDPSIEAATTALANDFDALPDRFVLVLDDYHRIGTATVHDVVFELLRHPPESVHFAIVSRRDPPWPIGVLRAGGQLHELRMEHLRFTVDEAAELVGRELGRVLSVDERVALDAATEGWAAGLRLAVHARRRGMSGDIMFGAGHLDRGAQEYLVAEVLEQLPSELARCLLAASYFDRFSAGLCDAVIGRDDQPSGITGAGFIDWLVRENLFVVPLDDEGIWFRFHHLFARLLVGWRSSHQLQFAFDDIEVHRAAAIVFREHQMLDEAIRELALAGETEQLVDLALEHGRELVDGDRWADLATLLDAVPADVFQREPALIVLRAWLVGEHGGRYRELVELLERAETLLEAEPPARSWLNDVRGQVAVLRGTYVDLGTCNFEAAMADADSAQQLLGEPAGRMLVQAHAISAIALANTGRYADSRRVVDGVVGDRRFSEWPMDPMVWVRPMVAWVKGSMEWLERGAAQLLATGERLEHQALLAYGHYFLGIGAYERNRLDDARSHLAQSIDIDYAIVEVLLHSGVALAHTLYGLGRPAEAITTMEATVQTVLDTRGDYNVPTAEAAMALLDLRCGRQPAALRWARAAEDEVSAHCFMYFDRSPALVEILLSSETDATRGRRILERVLRSPYGSFNRPVNLKLLGLDALDAARRGDTDRAVATLRVAVERAHECGFVRSVADLGPELVPLLHMLDVDGPVLDHTASILSAIPSGRVAAPDPARSMRASGGGPGLTDREIDVLRLLAGRYSNKEISRALLIAPATVKKHTVTLYDKLHVHGRREAVEKARALGYLEV